MIRIDGQERVVSCDVLLCRQAYQRPAKSAEEIRLKAHRRGWETALHPGADRTLDMCPKHAKEATIQQHPEQSIDHPKSIVDQLA